MKIHGLKDGKTAEGKELCPYGRGGSKKEGLKTNGQSCWQIGGFGKSNRNREKDDELGTKTKSYWPRAKELWPKISV